MSSGKRYKFIGSTFAVQTALGGPKDITSISQANPPVIGVSSHGFSAGDVVKTFDIVSPSQLDDQLIVVDNPNANDFEAAGWNGTSYAAFTDSSPGSYVEKVTFSEFCELTGANQQDGAADQHEVSTICSTAKEFEQGLSDPGTLQLDFNWAGNETVQAALRTAKIAATHIAFRIDFPGSGGRVVMIGTVQQTSFQGSIGSGVWTASATIRLSGNIFVLEAA